MYFLLIYLYCSYFNLYNPKLFKTLSVLAFNNFGVSLGIIEIEDYIFVETGKYFYFSLYSDLFLNNFLVN